MPLPVSTLPTIRFPGSAGQCPVEALVGGGGVRRHGAILAGCDGGLHWWRRSDGPPLC
jgi:hypothetical protein